MKRVDGGYRCGARGWSKHKGRFELAGEVLGGRAAPPAGRRACWCGWSLADGAGRSRPRPCSPARAMVRSSRRDANGDLRDARLLAA